MGMFSLIEDMPLTRPLLKATPRVPGVGVLLPKGVQEHLGLKKKKKKKGGSSAAGYWEEDKKGMSAGGVVTSGVTQGSSQEKSRLSGKFSIR